MFTREQILEINRGLRDLARRDTNFPDASFPFSGDELITLVQGGQNVKALLTESVSELPIDGLYKTINDANADDLIDKGIYYCIGNKNNFPEEINLEGKDIFLFTYKVNNAPTQYIICNNILYYRIAGENWNTIDFNLKQNIRDTNLQTEDKSIVGGINEIFSSIKAIENIQRELYHYLSQSVFSDLIRYLVVVRKLPEVQNPNTLYIVVPNLPDTGPGIGSMVIGKDFIIR